MSLLGIFDGTMTLGPETWHRDCYEYHNGLSSKSQVSIFTLDKHFQQQTGFKSFDRVGQHHLSIKAITRFFCCSNQSQQQLLFKMLIIRGRCVQHKTLPVPATLTSSTCWRSLLQFDKHTLQQQTDTHSIQLDVNVLLNNASGAKQSKPLCKF